MSSESSNELTHLDGQGHAFMVDVGVKDQTERKAVASGFVSMKPSTLDAIYAGTVPKGDVLAVARTAGIMGAKRTSDLIPLCHPLGLTHVGVNFTRVDGPDRCGIAIEAMAQIVGRTGVEMEALTAVSVAGLTIYDMAKAIDKAMTIDRVRLEYKSGGKSGVFQREDEDGEHGISQDAPDAEGSRTDG